MSTALLARRLRLGAFLLVAATAVACSDDDGVSQPVAVAKVEVSPLTRTLAVGDSVVLTAVAKDAAGTPLTRTIEWRSSDSTLARVDAQGKVTARRTGTATITAAAGGKSGTAQITITAAAVARLDITPPGGLTLLVGATGRLRATPRDAAGDSIPGRTVTWRASDATVATVEDGLVTAHKAGSVLVTASIDGVEATVPITISAPAPASDYDLVFAAVSELTSDIRLHALGQPGALALPLAPSVEGTYLLDPAPSPDGWHVAFVVARYGPTGFLDGDIYVADREGRNYRRLTSAPGLEDQPAWSPDGSRIAYRGRRADGRTDVMVVPAGGGAPANLTADQANASGIGGAAWSADGARLAFASDAGTFPFHRIWTMRADGSDKRRITAASGEANDDEPSWSPDGRSIVFRRIGGTPAVSDIAVVDVSTEAVRVIPAPGVQFSPAWSPDGMWIAFSSNEAEQNFDIYTVRPDGSQRERRVSTPAEDRRPRWMRGVRATAAGAILSTVSLDSAPALHRSHDRPARRPPADGDVPRLPHHLRRDRDRHAADDGARRVALAPHR